MPAGKQPTPTATGNNVAVNWTASSGDVPVSGYLVKRYNEAGIAQTIGAQCSGIISETTCTETAVPAGTWKWTVTPVNGNWRGAESAPSEAVTISPPRIVTTSAWDLRDASSATETNASDTTAFANDGRTLASGNFENTFLSTRYLQWDYASPLPAGLTTSSVSFDFRFRSDAGTEVACFYFDVISGGATIATYGSTTPGTGTSPWCTTSTSKLVSTPLPVVNSTSIANGLRIKVYGYESNRKPIVVDQATISGTSADGSFSIHAASTTDVSGNSGSPVSWPLLGADSAFYTTTNSWGTSFSASRYLRLTFPAYVPSGATVSGATFKHAYRAASNGSNTCWYFQAYSGSTLLATYGSPTQPISCNSSNSTWRTDTVSLTPAVGTAAQANNLNIRLYVATPAGSSRSQHDLAELNLTYTR